MGLATEVVPDIDPALTADEANRLIEDLKSGADIAAVESALGNPTLTHGDDTYYIGPGGHLHVRWDRDRMTSVRWIDGARADDTDLAVQRWLGYALSLLGLIYIIQFVRVVTTRVSLTDQGLKIRGRPEIPFGAMAVVRRDRSARAR